MKKIRVKFLTLFLSGGQSSKSGISESMDFESPFMYSIEFSSFSGSDTSSLTRSVTWLSLEFSVFSGSSTFSSFWSRSRAACLRSRADFESFWASSFFTGLGEFRFELRSESFRPLRGLKIFQNFYQYELPGRIYISNLKYFVSAKCRPNIFLQITEI